MLNRQTIAFYSQNHKKTNIFCEQNAELLNIKEDGACKHTLTRRRYENVLEL
jgi:hypothetical protein